jgi:hypothetical protein
MTLTSFGQVIGVTGPYLGFPGTISRQGERVVASRQFSPLTSTNNLNFGDPAVLVPSTTGGTWDSVADFIATVANIANVAAYFAGMAVREVQTQLAYPAGQTPGVLQVGYYPNGAMADVLERGSATVPLTVGTPSAGSQVYTRVVQNAAVTAPNGDWETNPVASDLFAVTGATASANSTALTLGATVAACQVGQVVSGVGIAAGTYVTAGTGGTGSFTAVTLSQATTDDIVAGQAITFSNLVALPGVVARTGYVDANGMVEITIKTRNAA